MHHSQPTTRRLIATLTFIVALIAAGFVSPRSAFAGYPIAGNICGISSTSVVNGYFLSGTTGSVVTMTVTSTNYSNVFLDAGIGGSILNIIGSGTHSGTVTLPDSLIQTGVYFLSIAATGSFTVTTSCPSPSTPQVTFIAGDNRLNNTGDQGAQSVAIYCNSDGSLNLIPLQRLIPGPGSTSIKDSTANNVIVKTAPLSSIKTSAAYGYGILVKAYADGSWTVYRAELGDTGKTYAYNIQPKQCPQTTT